MSLRACLRPDDVLEESEFPETTRQKIAIVVAHETNSQYALAAHSDWATSPGSPDKEATKVREDEGQHPRERAILRFAWAVVRKRGWAGNEEINSAFQAGLAESELIEAVGLVARNLFSKHGNHLVQPEEDVPLPA
jgi:alkylhydroperoxidase family enzyme